MENNTVFVLLAGGKSERMGLDKGLLKYKQTFWILEQLHRISKTNISTVYIGLGHNFQHYFDAIHWFENAQTKFEEFQNLNIKLVLNKHPELGTFSTLQSVLKEIKLSNTIILNPIDIPILNPIELNKIINTDNEIIIPHFQGKNGHPIKMKAGFWKNLILLNSSDTNARLDFQLKKINPIKISNVEVFDRAILINLNTKKDWISFLETTIS